MKPYSYLTYPLLIAVGIVSDRLLLHDSITDPASHAASTTPAFPVERHGAGRSFHSVDSESFLRYPLKDTVDKWAQSRGEDGNIGNGSRGPLDYTLALCHAANSLEPLAWLAAESGGYLVFPRLPTIPKRSFVDLLQFWERTMVELAELDSSIARALLDRQIEPTELAQLQDEWEDVVEWMTGFVAAW